MMARRISLIVTALICLSSGLAGAQERFGGLAGTVTDETKGALPGTTVTATNLVTGAQRVVVSGADGTYRVPDLDPGRYSVTFELDTFQKVVLNDVVVLLGRTVGVDAALKVGGLAEIITVNADATKQLDITKVTLAHNITAEEFDRLPKARSFQGLALTAPGVNAGEIEGGIQVKSVVVEATEEGYQFDADFEITLNHKLEHALEKGIVLYFVTELNLVSSRWYWLDERVAQSRVREGLSYYALTRQYRLSRGTFSQNFSTLKEALQALSRVRDRPIIPSTELRPDMEYAVEVRMRLDIAALPKPFQVETLGSRDWDLSTGILRWNTRLPSSKESHKSAVESSIDKIRHVPRHTTKAWVPSPGLSSVPRSVAL